MPPRRSVEAISWGMTCTGVGLSKAPRSVERRPGSAMGAASVGRSGGPCLGPPSPRPRLLPLVPGAERNPLGAIRRELLGPHGDERAVLPLEHVVLHARVRVLAGLVELHAPAVDAGPDRQIERQDGGAELVEVVALGGVECQLQDPETAARELMPARQHVRAGLGLHRLAEGALDLLALGPELLDDQARTRLEQREGPVGVVAERLAEAGVAVAGRARVYDGLDLEVLLARLAPEQDGVLVARDVMQDVGVRVLQLEDDRREVVGREGVVLEPDLLHAELRLSALAGRLGHALAVGRVLREVRDLQLVGLLAEAVGQVLGDELDVVPAEAGAVDLGAEHVLQISARESRIDAGRLPVDDVLPRRRLAGGAAE